MRFLKHRGLYAYTWDEARKKDKIDSLPLEFQTENYIKEKVNFLVDKDVVTSLVLDDFDENRNVNREEWNLTDSCWRAILTEFENSPYVQSNYK